MRRYYQREVYRCLAKCGPMSTVEVTHWLGLPYNAGTHHPTKVCAQVIHKMSKAGLVERVDRKWRVVAGTRAPNDKRGQSPASKLALRSHSRNNMAKLRARKGYHVKPIATTALEQAWGWLPSIPPRLTPDDESVAIMAHPPRPYPA